uniref:CHK kinase-like domain-containing protein n=1 Tax=Heliothis virescens TaxID=7102 RepID=A0A2A4JCM6_HELVI
MAQYNFEGDFANLNARQLDYINKVILEQDIKVKKVVFEQLGQAGDNFMGSLKRINIEGENGTISMILKIASSNEITRQTYHTGLMFKNEHIMYTEVLPKFVQLQKDAGVPPEEWLKFATCYGSFNEEPNEVILLEDLNDLNFSMMDKFKSLPDEYVRNVLKTFAVFHSLSFVMKKQDPETYNAFRNELRDQWACIAESDQSLMFMGNIEKDLTSIIEDNTYKSLLKNKMTDGFKLRKLNNLEKDMNYTVIQHGDAWTNNFMFRVVDDAIQSCMVDFQASNDNSPMSDVLFMIIICTDHETRSQNFYDWIDYYHTELDKSLSHFGLEANEVYPRDRLDADLKKYAKALLAICLLITNVSLRDSKEASVVIENMNNMEHEDDVMESFKPESLEEETVARINKKIGGFIESYKKFGLF